MLREAFTIAIVVVCVGATANAQSAGDPLPQVTFINQQIELGWTDNGLKPSAMASDGEWCRRVYLDILGRIPTFKEVQAYLKDSSAEKKQKLVNRLLYDDDYNEEYTRNMTTLWTNILIGRTGGTDNRSLTSRPGMQEYLRDSFAQNKPYDKMVFELISAEGSTKPGQANFNGATNFLAEKMADDGVPATAATARIFLGLQVQCTQCHNHPFNEWKQRKFWELNAFFRQTRPLRRFVDGTNDIENVELVNEDYGGENGNPEEAALFYELRNGLLKNAFPIFVDDTEISKSGFVSDSARRTELAKLIIESPYLKEAIANRMWGHFLTYGFTKPVDDMGTHNRPSHPELVKYLGEEFGKTNFDLKQLMKWIALSDAYGLSSSSNSGNKGDDPLLGESPKFSHFYIRQMRAEELYESLIVATQAHKTKDKADEQKKTKEEWMKQFVTAFGTDEGGESTTFNGTIPQALMMFNGELIKKATSGEKGSFLHAVANSKLSNAQKISYLYLAALARQPSSREVVVANKLFVARKGDSVETLQDVFWVLLNTNEFILNH